MKKMQYLSIKILNSQYRFVFNIILCLLIYACFKGNIYYTTFCVNENVPLIAEPKIPALKGTSMPTPLQTEVSSFLNQAGTIKQQEYVILDQKEEIENLHRAKGELIYQRNSLEIDMIELKRQKDLLEIDKHTAEELKNVYKEGFERLAKNNADLLREYQKDLNKAYKAGDRFGMIGFGLLVLTTFSIIVLTTEVKKN